jgi:hypothetical protein
LDATLHIIGTGHHYQFGNGTTFGGFQCTQACEDAFLSMLRICAVETASSLLAEELNVQAMHEAGCVASLLQVVARDLFLPHLFLEPDRAERVRLGISDENQLLMSAWPQKLEQSEYDRLVEESCSRREDEWIRRLRRLPASNTLVICGAAHVPTLCPRAIQAGFQIALIHANWQA